MAKKVVKIIKLQIPAGQANPAPPVGPALGQHGVNIMEFCKAFNAATAGGQQGRVTPVEISVYEDRSFTFITQDAARGRADQGGRSASSSGSARAEAREGRHAVHRRSCATSPS